MTGDQSIPLVIAELQARLERQFDGIFGPDDVADAITASAAEFQVARFTKYLPILVEKRARERLRVEIRRRRAQ